MVQKILSDKVMNERTNAYYSYYLGERNISYCPLMFMIPRNVLSLT
ncbi:ybl124 [Escherichia coli]|nr:ybl124 [Escherichia coli]